MPKPKRVNSHICDVCGKPYLRSNRLRLWTVRNLGHRDGWRKVDEKVCNNCMSQGQAQRVTTMVGIRIVAKKRTA